MFDDLWLNIFRKDLHVIWERLEPRTNNKVFKITFWKIIGYRELWWLLIKCEIFFFWNLQWKNLRPFGLGVFKEIAFKRRAKRENICRGIGLKRCLKNRWNYLRLEHFPIQMTLQLNCHESMFVQVSLYYNFWHREHLLHGLWWIEINESERIE